MKLPGFDNSKLDTSTAIRMALITKEQLGEKPVHGLGASGSVVGFAGEALADIDNLGAAGEFGRLLQDPTIAPQIFQNEQRKNNSDFGPYGIYA